MNALVRQCVFGMYHLYGNLILEITHLPLWVNSVNGHLLVNNDLHLSSQIPRRMKQGSPIKVYSMKELQLLPIILLYE
jgi:hypothetical protein